MSLRILHVVTLVDDDYSMGGPLTVAINQCRELRRRGHDARLAGGWRGPGEPPAELEGVPAYLFPVWNLVPSKRVSGLLSLRFLRWLRREVTSFDVGHIHAARDLIPLSAATILYRAGIPYTTQTHGMVLPDQRPATRLIDRLMTLRVLRNARARFVLTDDEEKAVIDLLDGQYPAARLANGISVPPKRTEPEGPLDVLFMARLHPRKRVMDFCGAAEVLISEGVDARFSIVGPDNGDLPAVRAFLAERPRVSERLRYEGPMPHAQAVERLRRAGVYVLPSVSEPFPMTLLEAIANGVPSVCTTNCGLAEQLEMAGAAAVVQPGTSSLAAELRLLINEPDRRHALGRRGAETARMRYSTEAVGDALLRTYEPEAVNA